MEIFDVDMYKHIT